MKYQQSFQEFHLNINENTESRIKYDKINCIRLKMNELRKKLSTEKEPKKKRKLQLRIQICELKISILQIK